MLIAELDTRRKVILLDSIRAKFTLYTSTRDEVEEIEILLHPHNKSDERHNNYDFLRAKDKPLIFEAFLGGNIREVTEASLKNIIPTKVHIWKDHNENQVIHECKCYQQTKPQNQWNNIFIHEDRLSSFYCACELIRAEYFIIIKEFKPFLPKIEVIELTLEEHKKDIADNTILNITYGDTKSGNTLSCEASPNE